MTEDKTITVVLADDHEIWRHGLRADLDAPFEVIGEAASAPEAVELVKKLQPTLVVSDLHMPDGGGLLVSKECSDISTVVILTVSEAERDLLDAIAAGAMGYLLKSTRPDDLKTQLIKATKGEPVFSPSLAALV